MSSILSLKQFRQVHLRSLYSVLHNIAGIKVWLAVWQHRPISTAETPILAGTVIHHDRM